MPVIKDKEGNVYRISSEELQKYKVAEADIEDVLNNVSDQDDVELQSGMSVNRISTLPHNWYSGD